MFLSNDAVFTADVTQFLLPNGRRRNTTVQLPAKWEEAYKSMQKSGYQFEAEILTTGEVSLTIATLTEGADVDIEIVPNGPDVCDALVAMLERCRWTIDD